MSLRRIRHFVEYILLRAVIGLVRLLPLDTAVAWSAKTWRTLGPYDRRHKRALDNLALAFPEKTEQERQAIALAMWANLGRVMAETMLLDRLIQQPERIELLDQHLVDRYRGRLGPAICVSLHMGNWELSMWPMVIAGARPAAVYRLVSNPFVENYLKSMRKELYPGGLFARGGGGYGRSGYDTARMLGSYARHGGRLGFLADLYDRNGVAVPFFGHPAISTSFPAMLARRVGSRMWISRCTRVGTGSRFKVHFKEIKVPRTENGKEDVRSITAEIQKQFEEWIRTYPEQWMWSNRKWS